LLLYARRLVSPSTFTKQKSETLANGARLDSAYGRTKPVRAKKGSADVYPAPSSELLATGGAIARLSRASAGAVCVLAVSMSS
jgi:hypothetical protein